MKSILLLHEWNYNKYSNMTFENDAWYDQKNFISKLEKKYKIYKLNFPGFCGEDEPDSIWTINDFVKYVNDYIKNNNLKIEYILGYSFGADVAIKYSYLYNKNQKLILISPVIIKNNNYFKNNKFTFLLPIKKIYVKYFKKNNYIINGDKFLNGSYQKINNTNLMDNLKKLNPKNVLIIFGRDKANSNLNFVKESLNYLFDNSMFFIENEDKNIINSHINELISIIDNFIK